ncbi:hypothetical protein KIAC18_000297 [Sporomusa sphaeroides]|uniref:hypothetical protein n=1 Tax=Sporomusa sphaeroides TaxID=47679 RepID=UPI003DA1BA4B
MGQKLANVTITAGGVYVALNNIKDILLKLVAPGFDFNKQMEASRLGIAGILQSMTRLKGQALSFAEALSISSDTMKKLMADAVRTGAEAEELIPTFQAILSPGLAAKMTLEQIRDIANYGANAVKAIMPGNIDRQRQMIQEIRDLVQGGIQPASSTLANALNIKDADITRAKNSAEGLYKFLMDRFVKLREMMDAYPQTLDGTISQFREVWTRTSAAVAKEFEEDFKVVLRTITRLLGEIDEKTGEIKINPAIIEAVQSLKEGIKDAGAYLNDFILFAGRLSNVVPSATLFLNVLKLILDHAGKITLSILAWMAISRVRTILAAIAPQVMLTVAAFRMLVATSGVFQASVIASGVAIKSLLVTTGWGILAVAIGTAADEMLRFYDNITKAGKAKKSYFETKEAAERDTNLANRMDILKQPVYNINPDVNIAGMDKEAFSKMEKFIAAINWLAANDETFKGGAVTVTSGYREWGGHVSGKKADIVVAGMEDPQTRRRIMALAKDFGIAVLDEVEGPATKTAEALANWGPHLDLDFGSPLDTSGLTPAFPKDQEEAIAKAMRAATSAAQENYLNEYLAQLEGEKITLKQVYDVGRTGVKEYYTKLAALTVRESTARIAKLQQDIVANQQLLANKNLGDDDRIKINSDIETMMSNITVEQTRLENALSTNTFEGLQAFKDLSDKAIDAMIALLEMQGQYTEAARKQLEKSSVKLAINQLRAGGFEKEAKALEAVNANLVTQAAFKEASTNLEIANEEMVAVQISLMNELATGAKTAAQATDEYVTQYNAKVEAILDDLRRQLDDAVKSGDRDLANKIRAAIREITDKLSEFFDAVIARIDAELQHELSMINADRSLTNMQRQDKIDEANRRAAARKAIEYENQAQKLREIDEVNKNNSNAATITKLEQAAALNRELAKMPSLLGDVNQAAKQGLEDGLLDFLERGILECRNLGDAFRNLAITVLQSINRMYAEALTKNIMNALFPNRTSTSSSGNFSWTLPNSILIPGKAEGGSLMDSGEVKGPGTSTSDDILAWIDNAKRWIRISNGEFVMRGQAVAKYGQAFLERLNSGQVPVSMLQRYAVGGSLTNRNAADIPGAQELSASLVNNNNTTIPLSIMNILDPGIMGKFIQTREGKRALLNYIKDDASTIRQILSIRG